MIKKSKNNSEQLPEVKIKRGRKKSVDNVIKGIGLFDHIKHIRTIQDPNYFKTLTELDIKSFNHFMILKALSMNPALLDDISSLFRYFDKIPSPQFYQLLIGLLPPDPPQKFFPWVKSKKSIVSKQLVELISRHFETSNKESAEYAMILSSTENGKKELREICRDYGLTEDEVESALKGSDKDE